MRKLLSLFSATILTCMASCIGNSSTSDTNASTIGKSVNQKVLIAYFSATGNTRKAAQQVAKATGGTLYEIVPEQPYTDDDLDYEDKKSRTSIEKDDTNIRPTITSSIDIAPYSTIYLGFPIWWYRAPLIISSFLENHDFQDKTIVVFATSGSSTLDSSFETLKKEFPKYTFVKGAVLNSMTSDKFNEWLNSIKN